MTKSIGTTLDSISHGLYVGSLNYSPSFLVVELKGMAGQSLQKLIDLAIRRTVVIGGTQSAKEADLLVSVKEALYYQGDDGSHPDRGYLASVEFQRNAELVMSEVGKLVDGADTIMSFWLKEGHPFYPVFWDFAYLIEINNDAIVFIGSSSD
ncbi:hypothetical protein [Methylotenera sp. G11]|uniref:hypothetical protein n=1 Tax=Methylotenera sp. G11 TaxID=1506585 RepID=UPI00126A2D67|nr:hypothetical protein [Methylotenera sp. G11]